MVNGDGMPFRSFLLVFRKGANYGRIIYLAEIRSKRVAELLPLNHYNNFLLLGKDFPFQRILVIIKSFWFTSL